jgi:hypothetical protein
MTIRRRSHGWAPLSSHASPAPARGLLPVMAMKLRPLALTLPLLAALLANTRPAQAEDAPPASVTEWYGWQTLTIDALSIGLMGTSLASHLTPVQVPFGFVGLGGYTLGAPTVHAAHKRWVLAAVDLGVRAASLLGGGAIGLAIGAATEPSCVPAKPGGSLGTDLGAGIDCGTTQAGYQVSAMLVGAGIGVVAAALLDGTVLARQTLKAHADTPPPPAFSWAPSLAPLPSGGAAGVTGTF